jgi:cysteine desulfurase
VIDLDWLANHLGSDVAGVSLMAANNETGVRQPLAHAHALCQRFGAWLHVDATQALGRVGAPDCWDLLTLSGHKAGGLKGAGALIVRPDVHWTPQLLGGDQERGARAGTVNVPAVVALGTLVGLPCPRLAPMRDRLQQAAEDLGLVTTSSAASRLPNTLHLRLPGVPGETLAQALDLEGICVSTGAACASGASKPSPVLAAMGLPADEGLRLSLGWSTSTQDIDATIAALQIVVPRCAEAFGVPV